MAGKTGYTKVQNTDPMQGPAQITGVYEHFDPLIGEEYPTRQQLPVSGNWPGRTVWVSVIERLVVWTGSGWRLVDGSCYGEVAITPTGGSSPYQGEADIVFPVGLYTVPPSVSATPVTESSAAQHVGVREITTDGCRITYTRANTTATRILWSAVGK